MLGSGFGDREGSGEWDKALRGFGGWARLGRSLGFYLGAFIWAFIWGLLLFGGYQPASILLTTFVEHIGVRTLGAEILELWDL